MDPQTHFIKNGNTYTVAPKGSIVVENELPPKTFVLKSDPNNGFYLNIVEEFTLPRKIYGDTLKLTDRILNTFFSRSNSTGVLLAGEKGSGKTLLAKSLCLTGASRGVPTIIINTPFKGDNFNSFIQSINQPCIVLFDEFEKVYDSDDQEKILTLLDGVFQSKKLFILTCNDKYKIDVNMKNRPGRIYYLLDFKGISEEFVKEYCEDNLKNKAYINEVIKVSSLFDVFNFDLLSVFVEEINRYDESPLDLLPLLNAKPEYCQGLRYVINRLSLRDIEIPLDFLRKNDVCKDMFNLSNDDWNISLWFSYSSNDEEVSKLVNNFNYEEYDGEVIYDLLKRKKISVIDRSKGHSIGLAIIGKDKDKDKNKDRKEFYIEVVAGEEDIFEYVANGANYETETGFCLEVKRGGGRKKKKSSMDNFDDY